MYIKRVSANLCNEFSFVNVQVSSANTTSLDLDQDIVVSQLGKVNRNNGELLRLCVP